MQRVRQPRFYVDWGLWQKSLGVFKIDEDNSNMTDHANVNDLYDLFGLNVKVKEFETMDLESTNSIAFSSGINLSNDVKEPNYLALLGHNLHTINSILEMEAPIVDSDLTYDIIMTNIVNYDIFNENTSYNGFTMVELIGAQTDYLTLFCGDGASAHVENMKMGAISYGRYHEIDYSPDLKLTQIIDMDGIKTQKTKGGYHLSDATYTSSQKWGDLGAWELQSSPPNYWNFNANLGARSGRRIWDLSFSFISQEDLLPDFSLGVGDYQEISDNLIFNSTFDNSMMWVPEGDWGISGGVLSYDGSSYDYVYSFIPSLVAGGTYKVSLKVVTDSGNPLVFSLGGNTHWIYEEGENVEFEITAGSDNFDVGFYAGDQDGSGRWNGSIDNVSVIRVTGTESNLFGDNDFLSEVWNKTLGGTLPFIFQPDNNNNNPDQFAICKFDQDSLDLQRVSPSVMNLKLKIKEVW